MPDDDDQQNYYPDIFNDFSTTNLEDDYSSDDEESVEKPLTLLHKRFICRNGDKKIEENRKGERELFNQHGKKLNGSDPSLLAKRPIPSNPGSYQRAPLDLLGKEQKILPNENPVLLRECLSTSLSRQNSYSSYGYGSQPFRVSSGFHQRAPLFPYLRYLLSKWFPLSGSLFGRLVLTTKEINRRQRAVRTGSPDLASTGYLSRFACIPTPVQAIRSLYQGTNPSPSSKLRNIR